MRVKMTVHVKPKAVEAVAARNGHMNGRATRAEVLEELEAVVDAHLQDLMDEGRSRRSSPARQTKRRPASSPESNR